MKSQLKILSVLGIFLSLSRASSSVDVKQGLYYESQHIITPSMKVQEHACKTTKKIAKPIETIQSIPSEEQTVENTLRPQKQLSHDFAILHEVTDTHSLSNQKVEPSHKIKTFSDNTDDSWVQVERSNDKATATVQTGYGKIQVTCEVENVDFASQCKAEWGKAKKNKEGEVSGKDIKDAHSPKAMMKISWASDE